MEVREVLEGMLDILHEKEWIKGHMYKTGERSHDEMLPLLSVDGVCLEGACNLVLWQKKTEYEGGGTEYEGGGTEYEGGGWLPIKTLVSEAILAAAVESCPEKYQDWMTVMFQFNDFGETTREDVILAVKTAITRLEES